MPRLTNLDSVLFPIVQERLLSERSTDDPLRPIPAYTAIVNQASGQVLGVVSRHYRVVTNEEAVELGRRCCRELFGLGAADRLDILGVDAPASGTHCYVDLAHPASAMNLLGNGQVPETYVPYVRVTNSYNRSRALRFDVGFCRKLCDNGVIFEQETIHFTYSHVRRELDPAAIQFRIGDDRLQRLAERFRRFVGDAQQMPMGEDESRATIRRVLGIPNEEVIARQTNPRRRLRMLSNLNAANECLRRYRAELGPNAYAVFNAMTELARTLGSAPGMYRDTHSMQKLAGAWLAEFSRAAGTADARRAA